MGEKSGGLTNMVIGIVATVALIAFVNIVFPDVTASIGDKLTDVVSSASPSQFEGHY